MKKVKIAQALLSVVGLGCMAATSLAQAPISDVSVSPRRVEVVEDSGRTYGTAAAVSDTGSVASGEAQGGSMFQQMQQMRQEIATLRGQVEEQSYELQKLKQQHQEDFANLDRRVSGSGSSTATATQTNASTPAAASNTTPPAQSGAAATNSDGRDEYEAAYALLKAKDYSGANSAFKNFVAKYPNSEYAGNSWFWLGFVHQTQGDMDSAAKSFSSLIEQFPKHAKVDDARYNLGKIYHQQGKNDQARTLLKQVAAGSSKSAPLAKSYLESM